MVFIKYTEIIKGNKKFIKIDEAVFLEDFDFEYYLRAMEEGYVNYEFRTHGNASLNRISKEIFFPCHDTIVQ